MVSAGAEPSCGASHLVEVLDRILDRGIMIDAELRFNLVGLNLVGVEARIVVATIEPYLEYADDVALTGPGVHRLKRYFDEDAGDAPWDVGGS